jgi:hypothetical protein
MGKDPMHKTVCTTCYRGTWYETEGQACRMSIPKRCECCGSVLGDQPCPGKLKLIDRSALAPQFAGYYESEERIKVRFAYGEEKFGTVGKTTGWRPVYLLMPRIDSIGSTDTLGADDKVIAVKRDGRYIQTYFE